MINKRMLNILMIAAVMAFGACSADGDHPGYAYFPDMTYSQAYEPYSEVDSSVFSDRMEARLPATNTIPRGFEPFHFENTVEEYERAGEELLNPLEATEENIREGQYFFSIYCAVCHGGGGEGNGPIVEGPAGYPPPPSFYNDYMMELSDGRKFFTIHYGKGLMGSYASQLSKEERWKVILYINKLQDENAAAQDGEGATAQAAGGTANDTTQTATAN